MEKVEPFGVFWTSIVLQNRKILKGGILWRHLKKVSQSQNNMQKKLVKGEIRAHALLLGTPQKLLLNLYAKFQ